MKPSQQQRSPISRTVGLLLLLSSALAFQVSPPTRISSRTSAPSPLQYAATLEAPLPSQPNLNSLRKLVMPKPPKPQQQQPKQQPQKNKLPNMYESLSLSDYKQLVADETERLVVVRFYAPWCRACKKVAPLLDRLAAQNPSIKFVQVPLVPSNQQLIAGLDIQSIPFGHIYHPTAGLVEERSMNSKFFNDFSKIVQTYVAGECALPPLEGDAYCSPYKYDQQP